VSLFRTVENLRLRYPGASDERIQRYIDLGGNKLSIEETQRLLGAEKPIPVANVGEALNLFRDRHKTASPPEQPEKP
jgi:hypothetical protein